MSVERQILGFLKHLPVLPRRLSLSTPGVQTSITQLRGVWGAALRGLDRRAYDEAFEGTGPAHERTPTYVLRPAPPDPQDSPALEFILIGQGLEHDRSLMRAWDVASGMGLGPQRRAFFLRRVQILNPEGCPEESTGHDDVWPLSKATLPTASAPCRLVFDAPVRLIRNRRFVPSPTLPDFVVAACRRIRAFAPPAASKELELLTPALTDIAKRLPAGPWNGQRLDLHRYSGRQKSEIELHGVAGHLDLPDGPGELWPLLAAAQWLHLGKATVFGMGCPRVIPIP